MAPINMINILQPKAECVSQLKDLFSSFAAQILEHEDGCLEYSVYVQKEGKDGIPNVILHERYVDQAALDFHLQTTYFEEVKKVMGEGDLLRAPLDIKGAFVIPIAGHAAKHT